MQYCRRVSVPVATRAPTGQTAAYLLGTGNPLLVDPPARSDELDEAVDAAGVKHVAVTHTHPDHVGAVEASARRTGATVWARRGREDQFTEATGIEPDRTFVDGTRIGPATVLDTPGHAPEHVAFSVSVPSDDGSTVEHVVTGDLAVAEGSVVVGAPDGDMRAYLTSLRRLHARDPERLHPAHGPVIDAPRSTLARLLEHRLDRERRVRQAVDDGAGSLEAVLDEAYDKSLDGVKDLARATVRAHLRKLAVESEFRERRSPYHALRDDH